MKQELGERVMVVGFSGGGTVAAWQAHNRRTILSAYHLEPDLKLPRDFISPGAPGLEADRIHQLLIPMILDGMQ